MEKMVYARKNRLVRELTLLLANLEIHPQTAVGAGLVLQHRGMGTVIHPSTEIGSGVTLYHQVTVGRKDGHVPGHLSPMEKIVIGDGAILYPGAKVLGGAGVTRVGRNTIIAANAVLTQSTGDNEIWAGMPAKKVGDRTDSYSTAAHS